MHPRRLFRSTVATVLVSLSSAVLWDSVGGQEGLAQTLIQPGEDASDRSSGEQGWDGTNMSPLLDVAGFLEPGDEFFSSDNTLYLYDLHTFEGQAGQTVSIVMESLVFDPYIWLGSPDGEVLTQNDDYGSRTRNAAIVMTLPQDGRYFISANAYGTYSRGAYRITVIPVLSEQDEPVFSDIGQRQIEAYQLNQQGLQHLNISEYPEALVLFERSLVISQDIDNRFGEGHTLNNIGLVYDNLSDYEQALVLLEESLAIHQEVGNRNGEGVALNNIARVYERLGNYQQALNTHQESLAIRQEIGDRNGESITLNNIGSVYDNLSDYEKALAFYEESLTINREIGNRSGEGVNLNNIAGIYKILGSYEQALSTYKESLAIRQELGNRAGEGTTLNNIGLVYAALSAYKQALTIYKESLVISQEIGDRAGEGTTLNNIGSVYGNLGEYQQALTTYQKSLMIRQEIGDRAGEGTTLNNIGLVYDNLGDYQQALSTFQESLTISQEIGNRRLEGITLSNIGSVYEHLGEYQQALLFHQESLAIRQDIADLQGESVALNNIAVVYEKLGDYERALSLHQDSLAISQKIGDRAGEGASLNNIGSVHQSLGNYQQALALYQESLIIRQDIGDRAGEGTALSNIGLVYDLLSEYERALIFYQESLIIRQDIGDRHGEGVTLNNIGRVYKGLGQHKRALEVYQESLTIVRETGDRLGEGIILSNIGLAYNKLGEYERALSLYRDSLAISEEIGDRLGEGISLNHIATVYRKLGEYEQALVLYQDSLAIHQNIGNRENEGVTLNGIGKTRQLLGDYEQALSHYQESLAISQEIGDRAGEGKTLNNLGELFALQEQPELAIVFYKQSVKVREDIRADIKGLSQEQRQSFTDTIADDYRALADLLLQQNRILEAQQILELLKVQELDDFLHNVRGTPDNQITILRPEVAILEKYQDLQQSVITLTREQAELRDRKRETGERTPEERERLVQIDAILSDLSAQFYAFRTDPDVQEAIESLSFDAREQAVSLGSLTNANLQDDLQNLNAALLYPLILDDRIELVITTPDSDPIQRTVQGIGRVELNAAITAFRQALDDPNSDAISPAQQLYRWLIEPLENDLAEAKVDTIIYAPDGALRYIPLAALHDGDEWLAERFRINHITAYSLTGGLDHAPQPQPHILAGAFSDPSITYDVPVNGSATPLSEERTLSFNGLPYAGEEVKSLVATLPNIDAHFDESFDLKSLRPFIGEYNILHFATHAAFLPDYPINSFILSGNGNTLSLQSLREEWDFSGIDLVVLSACETGLGGYDNNGEQILGLGYVFQQKGANAVMASLWQVSDRGTQTLMDAFYAALNNGYGKAEALQRAQQALITGHQTVLANPDSHQRGDRGVAIEIIDAHTGRSLTPGSTLNHPYYWAPFILIGNGL